MAEPKGNVKRLPSKSKDVDNIQSGSVSFKDENNEPLSGPSASEVGKRGGMVNLKGLHQNQEGKDPLVDEVPAPADVTQSDFGGTAGFSAGTKRNTFVGSGEK